MKIKIREFYFYQCSNGRSSSTSKTYRAILEDFESKHSAISLKDISPAHLQDYLSSFQGLSASSLNIKRACFKSFFRWALENDFLAKDPSRLIHLQKVIQAEAKFLSLAEVKRFREAIKGTGRDEVLFSIFLQTGMRLSEVATLNCDIKGKSAITIVGKGRKSRQIYFPKELVKLIGENVNGHPENHPLFISCRGERLSASGIQGLFKRYLEKAGIDPKKYHIHSLRHSFASHLYKKSKDILLVSQLLGHSSIQTTCRYSHLSDSRKRAAIQGIYA